MLFIATGPAALLLLVRWREREIRPPPFSKFSGRAQFLPLYSRIGRARGMKLTGFIATAYLYVIPKFRREISTLKEIAKSAFCKTLRASKKSSHGWILPCDISACSQESPLSATVEKVPYSEVGSRAMVDSAILHPDFSAENAVPRTAFAL